MQHDHWAKHGRVFTHADEGAPNKKTYRTHVGETNVDVNGDGSTFAPYVVDAGAIRHGDSSCTFDADGQSFRRLGQVLISRSQIYIQRQAGQNWNNVPHGTPTRNVLTDTPVEGKCTAYLDFPEIQGYAQGARFQVGMEVGGSDRQKFGFRMRSPQAGTFRLEWVIELPANADLEWIDAPTGDRHNPTGSVHIGGRIGPVTVRWTVNESPLRTVTVENLGAAGRIVHVFFGPYTLAAQEWLDISPDMTDLESTTAGDDWYIEYNGSTWDWYNHYYDSLYTGKYNSRRCWAGFRFTLSEAIPDNATIDGSVLSLYKDPTGPFDEFTTGDSLTVWATQSADAPQVTASAARPNVGTGGGSTTVCATSVRWPASGDLAWDQAGWNNSNSLAAIIQELVDDYNGLAQNAHVVLWTGHTAETSGSKEVGVEAIEYSGTNAAMLDIAWTEGGEPQPVLRALALLGAGL